MSMSNHISISYLRPYTIRHNSQCRYFIGTLKHELGWKLRWRMGKNGLRLIINFRRKCVILYTLINFTGGIVNKNWVIVVQYIVSSLMSNKRNKDFQSIYTEEKFRSARSCYQLLITLYIHHRRDLLKRLLCTWKYCFIETTAFVSLLLGLIYVDNID
jgi:hypothetical protein